MSSTECTYRGHRRQSFEVEDINELVELRARQRTFHGAYNRTALGCLGYALTILRFFDKSYHLIGILFAVLGALLYIIAFFRARHSIDDFADRYKQARILDCGLKTKGQEGTRIFGRPFVTAGWTVVQVTIVVAAAELGLVALIVHRT